MAIIIEDSKNLYSLFNECKVVSTDTRKIAKGSIFFCLQGANFNGNSFAAEAIQKGAAYAVIDEAEYDCGNQCILVENTLHALQKLALFHRSQFQIPVVGITGTNGKTTTKELVNAVLSKKYNIHATSGNLNNHIGVPLTLLGINSETEIAVVEMGANHIHEISELCEIARPDYGLITSIGKAHLEGFGSIEGVIKAKSELYQFINRYGKMVFVNHDDALLKKLSDQQKRICFGSTDDAFTQARLLPNDGFVKLLWKDVEVVSQLVGDYNFSNILAAICIGQQFEVPDASIIEAIQNYKPQNQRSQLLVKDSNTLVIDAYNANPTSMLAALTSLKTAQFNSKSVILGDMLELGNESLAEHKIIVEFLKDLNLANVLLVGPVFSSFEHPFLKFANALEAKDYLIGNRLFNQYILIKGSRGIHLEDVLEVL